MFQEFERHLLQNFPQLAQKRLLLAVSGGLDSMAMASLFMKLPADVAIAHCNFKLRNEESDADERFVLDFFRQKNIPVFTQRFDTKKFASDYRLSKQEAARKLRYDWFSELLQNEGYDFLLTAHHADDNLETFLINLTRGTGIEGLTGIPHQNGKIVRPMLPFSRDEIGEYAKTSGLEWREDSSNASDAYLRNKIRHHIVPVLKNIKPGFLDTFSKTQTYLNQTQTLAEDAAILVYQRVATESGDQITFSLPELLKLPNYRSYLFQWLREFGFTAWEDVYDLVSAETGKIVASAKFRLIKNRNELILSPLQNVGQQQFEIAPLTEILNYPLKLRFTKSSRALTDANSVIFVDAEKLVFPLTVKRWENGDRFYPMGMDSQSKKVGKFFKDEKFSVIDKENAWLLCSGNDIVWIIGHRQDERFKTNQTTTNLLQIAFYE